MSEHPNMSDTLIACCGSIGYMLPYMRGEYAPHYPVPAIRCEVAIDHYGTTVYVDSFYTCGDQVLWDIVADTRDTTVTRETI